MLIKWSTIMINHLSDEAKYRSVLVAHAIAHEKLFVAQKRLQRVHILNANVIDLLFRVSTIALTIRVCQHTSGRKSKYKRRNSAIFRLSILESVNYSSPLFIV